MFRQIAKLHRFLDTLHTTHNSFIRSDEGLTFETSVSLRNSLKMIVNSVSNITQFLCPKQLNRTSNKPTRSKTFKIKHSYAASQTKYLIKQTMALPRYFFFCNENYSKIHRKLKNVSNRQEEPKLSCSVDVNHISRHWFQVV